MRRARLAAGQRDSADRNRADGAGAEVRTSRPPSDEPHTRETLAAICDALITHESELNALDARVGDGDTGTTFATAARTVLSAINALPLAEHDKLCASVGARLSQVMGGTSGVLLSIFAAATGRTLAAGATWAAAMREGVDQMRFYGGAGPGDRTMLDALMPGGRRARARRDCARPPRAPRAKAPTQRRE